MLNIFYRRPKSTKATSSIFIRKSDVCEIIDEDGRRPSTIDSFKDVDLGKKTRGIPDELSFDRMMSGTTCSPCSTQEFLTYLSQVEYTAENLQFYLWHENYIRKFSDLSDRTKAQSPPWDENFAATITGEKKITFPPKAKRAASGPPVTFAEFLRDGPDSEECDNYTSQPFRSEVAKINDLYITRNAPLELNIRAADRTRIIKALEQTTHPSAFNLLKQHAELSLRCHSHPNFIRFAIANGSSERLTFARCAGIFYVLSAILIAVVITLSSAARWWRATPSVLLALGIVTLVLASKGICTVLYATGKRHRRPWELLPSDIEGQQRGSTCGIRRTGLNARIKPGDEVAFAMGSDSSGSSFMCEKYRKRSWLNRVLEQETTIEEPAIRKLQKTLFVQAVLFSLLGVICFLGLFLSLPSPKLF